MKNAALNKSFDQKLRWMIAPGVSVVEFGEDGPNFVASLAAADAKCRNFISRLDYPRRRHVIEKPVNVVTVESSDIVRTCTPAELATFLIVSLSRNRRTNELV